MSGFFDFDDDDFFAMNIFDDEAVAKIVTIQKHMRTAAPYPIYKVKRIKRKSN